MKGYASVEMVAVVEITISIILIFNAFFLYILLRICMGNVYCTLNLILLLLHLRLCIRPR